MIQENSKQQLHILVVDDNQSMRTHMIGYLRAYFTHVNSNITEAIDGEQAVEIVKTAIEHLGKNYDLIVMDFEMPKLNGQQATSAIRELEKPLGAEQMSKVITWSSAWHSPFKGADIALPKRFNPFEFKSTLEALGFVKD